MESGSSAVVLLTRTDNPAVSMLFVDALRLVRERFFEASPCSVTPMV
ncbi:MAG: hypothetical protein OXN44_02895 [Acidimicrobiaceae bacterium]|nr:hypothetical protein [Acidimicrobiaceae bacterium]MDE0607203.1 hypothetical protein [Acidimicrobiaceae bacterium]